MRALPQSAKDMHIIAETCLILPDEPPEQAGKTKNPATLSGDCARRAIPARSVRDEVPHRVAESVQAVVLDPVTGTFERDHFRRAEMRDPAILLRVGGPAF